MKTPSTPSKSVSIQHYKSPAIKQWRNMTFTEKLTAELRSAEKRGGRAVTVNLSPPFEELLKKSKNPMRIVGKRMNKALNAHGIHELPILLLLEAAKDNDRLHLHGVFIRGEHPMEVIKLALRKAVGLVPGRSGATQFHQCELYCFEAWATYITKAIRKTEKLLNSVPAKRLIWESQPILQLARKDHDAAFLAKAANVNCTPANRSA